MTQATKIMTNEEWKTIPDWPDYEVSSEGNFRRTTPGSGTWAGRPCKTFVNSRTGYSSTTLSFRGETERRSLTLSCHRVVAQIFIPNPENKKEVDHINNIRSDNRVENLRWATPSENTRRFRARPVRLTCKEEGTVLDFDALVDALEFLGISNMKFAYWKKKKHTIFGNWILEFVDEIPPAENE